MKRVAIITITLGTVNFGNRLQNYALQTALEAHGAAPETIRSATLVRNSAFFARGKRFLRRFVKPNARIRQFEAFERRYLRFAKRIRYGTANEHVFNGLYDVFIAGSDQIWNPTFWFNSDFEWMTFADPDKRCSYAASFGISEVAETDKPLFAARLRDMRRISVRENESRELVKQLSGREADVHLDPTLLLSAGQYAAIEEAPPVPMPGNYLLVFFIREVAEEFRPFIEEVAERQGLTVVELNDSPDSPLFPIGPQHFLHLIHHAAYVCTDSFHTAAFSILFHRQFTAFYRLHTLRDMNSRIDTLLGELGLRDRLYGAQTPEQAGTPIPYGQVDARLDAGRAVANRYLKEILGA